MPSKLNEGIVLSVGPGKRDKDGSLLPMGVKADDKVLLLGGRRPVGGARGGGEKNNEHV